MEKKNDDQPHMARLNNLANADKYKALIKEEMIVGIHERGIPRFKGIQLLRRHLDHEVKFITIMIFDPHDSVREFAVEDYETAVVPKQACKLLSLFDERSLYHEIVDERSGEL